MDSLISLITLVLAVSLAGERLVTLLKTMIPYLADDPSASKSPKTQAEIVRKTVVMLIAFLSCWLTAYLLRQNVTSSGSEFTKLPPIFLGVLASGGSAFWTSLLGYTKAVRDIKVQQNQQEQITTQHQKATSDTFQVQARVNRAMTRLSSLKAPSFSDTSKLINNRI